MKLGTQSLKITPLLAILLVAVGVFAIVTLKPNAYADGVASNKKPVDIHAKSELQKEPESSKPFTLEDLKNEVPQTKEGYFQLGVAELFYSTDDREVRNVLADQIIEIKAPIRFEIAKDSREHLIMVYQPEWHPKKYSVVLKFKTERPSLKEHQWVRVIGKPEYKTENDKPSLCLSVTSIESTNEASDE